MKQFLYFILKYVKFTFCILGYLILLYLTLVTIFEPSLIFIFQNLNQRYFDNLMTFEIIPYILPTFLIIIAKLLKNKSSKPLILAAFSFSHGILFVSILFSNHVMNVIALTLVFCFYLYYLYDLGRDLVRYFKSIRTKF